MAVGKQVSFPNYLEINYYIHSLYFGVYYA